MKKPILLVLFTFVLLSLNQSCCRSCDDDGPLNDDGLVIGIDDDDPVGGANPDDPDVIEPQTGNIVLDVIVSFPEGSTQNTEDISVSSLFNTDDNLENGVKLEMFDTNELELVVATNNQEEPYMLGYVQPNMVTSFNLNSESTALATILFHPWTFELSSEEKVAAMDVIKLLPEFSEFLVIIDNNIKQGRSLNPIGREKVIEAYLNIDIAGKNDIATYGKNIVVDVNSDKITVTKFNSKVKYGVGLYESSNGTPLSVSLLGSETEPTEIVIPGNGYYDVRVKNGLIFDGTSFDQSDENKLALSSNSTEVLFALLTLVSGKIGDDIVKTGSCGWGAFLSPALVPTAGLFKSWVSFVRDEISPAELIIAHSLYIQQRENDFFTTLEKCSPSIKVSEKAKLWGSVLKALSFIKDVYDGGVIIKDLNTKQRKLDFCFIKSDEGVSYCNGLTLSGPLDFGRVPIGKSSDERVLVISNNLDIGVDIDGLELPEGFSSFPDIKERIIINPGGNLQLEIKYTPTKIESIVASKITIENGADQVNNKITVSGSGVNALKSDKIELDFGKTPVDETSEPRTITLENDSDVDIVLRAVGLIDGYTFNVPEQQIAAGESIPIEVTFKPTDDFEDYNGQIVFKTDTDQADLIVELKGDGFKGLNLEVLSEPKDLDFGQVSTSSLTGETKNLRIINPTDIPITINGFLFIGEAQGGYTTTLDGEITNGNGLELMAGAIRDFSINFKPDTERTYNGDFIIDNTESQDALISLPITGEGVLNELSVTPNFLDFGEVELNGTPSVRTFELTNNLLESANIRITTGNQEVTIDNWTDDGTLAIGQSVTISASFAPNENTTAINNAIQVEAANLNESVTVNYIGSKKEDDLTQRVLNIKQWLWHNSINQTFSASFFQNGTCTFSAFTGTDGTWSLEGNVITAHFDEPVNDWDFDFQGVYNEATDRFEGDMIQTGTGIPTTTIFSELY